MERCCVLKSATRLLSGASMEAHSMLQEHTLVLAGESVDCGSAWQGWPSRQQVGLESYRASLRRQLEVILRRQHDDDDVGLDVSTSPLVEHSRALAEFAVNSAAPPTRARERGASLDRSPLLGGIIRTNYSAITSNV